MRELVIAVAQDIHKGEKGLKIKSEMATDCYRYKDYQYG